MTIATEERLAALTTRVEELEDQLRDKEREIELLTAKLKAVSDAYDDFRYYADRELR